MSRLRSARLREFGVISRFGTAIADGAVSSDLARVAGGAWTVAGWVGNDVAGLAATGNVVLFEYRGSSGVSVTGARARLEASGALSLIFYNASAYVTEAVLWPGGLPFIRGRAMRHFAVTLDGRVARCWIDGVAGRRVTMSQDMPLAADTGFHILSSDEHVAYDWRICPRRAVGTEDVHAMMRGERHVPGQRARWFVDVRGAQGSATLGRDVSGHGNNAPPINGHVRLSRAPVAFSPAVRGRTPIIAPARRVAYAPASPGGSDPISGSAAGSLGALAGLAAGVVAVVGAAAGSLAPLAGAATATAAVSAVAAGQLGALTGAATAAAPIAAVAGGQLASVTGAASATAAIAVSAAGALAAVTGSGAGVVGAAPIEGVAAGQLAALTGAGTGAVAVAATAAGSLASSTGAAVGAVALQGAGAGSLATLTGAAAGVVGTAPITGAAAGQLAALSGAGAGSVAVAGQASGALGTYQPTATGGVRAEAAGEGQLGALAGAAAGTVADPPVGPQLALTIDRVRVVPRVTIDGVRVVPQLTIDRLTLRPGTPA